MLGMCSKKWVQKVYDFVHDFGMQKSPNGNEIVEQGL